MKKKPEVKNHQNSPGESSALHQVSAAVMPLPCEGAGDKEPQGHLQLLPRVETWWITNQADSSGAIQHMSQEPTLSVPSTLKCTFIFRGVVVNV